MSFARAKRFSDKDSDVTVSPADYYINSSSNRAVLFSKCKRFSSQHKEASILKSKHTFRNGPKASSTPKKGTCAKDNGSNKEQTIHQERNCMKNTSLRRFFHQRVLENKFKNNRHRNDSITEINFRNSEEFIDDDYQSYTSTAETDSSSVLYGNPSDKGYFDEYIMEQINVMRMDMQEINNSIKQLKGDINKKHSSDMCQYANISDITSIIHQVTENVRSEFESRQNLMLSEVFQKLTSVANEIYKSNKIFKNDIENECRKAALDLNRSIVQILQNKKSGTKVYDIEFQKIRTALNHHRSFSYENICRVLSELLQVSQKELEELKQHKSRITVKYGNTRKKIEAQTSFINKLHEDVAEIKHSF